MADPLNDDVYSGVIEFFPDSIANGATFIQWDNGTNGERISLNFNHIDHHVGIAVATGGAVRAADPAPPGIIREGEVNRIAWFVDKIADQIGICINGGPVKTVTLTGLGWPSGLTVERIGAAVGSYLFQGDIGPPRYFDGRLSDAELTSLSVTTSYNEAIGGAGSDVLIGTDGRDYLVGETPYHGTRSADRMAGAGGGDFYWVNHTGDTIEELAFGGYDTVFAEVDYTLEAGQHIEELRADRPWVVTLSGNEFGNKIAGSIQDNSLFGNDGDDNLQGDSGNDTVNGGNGADTLAGGRGDDSLNGGGGADTADYGAASSRLVIDLGIAVQANSGGQGADTLSSIENVRGGGFADTLTGNGVANQLLGGGGNDTLRLLDGNDGGFGEAGADTIFGGLGNDRIDGGADGDTWLGGDAGADNITGGAGDDRIDGGDDGDAWLGGEADADIITGGGGNDRIDGGDGDDGSLSGGGGADYVTGGLGNDRIDGGGDNDALYSGGGSDFISGGAGDDIIGGAEGDDGNGLGVLRGEDGDDTIHGGLGFDRLEGGNGDDRLVGGAGSDRLAGGAGRDTIVFALAGEGSDWVDDWNPADDALEIDASGFGGGLTAGALAANRLVAGPAAVGAAPAATQAFGQFLYNTATGLLWWDADGTGLGAAVGITRLYNGGVAVGTLAVADFDIVA